MSRRERFPAHTHRRNAFKAWLITGAAALVAGGSQVITALPAAADTDVTLYASASSVNTTTPCTNSGDPCTLATAINEADGDTGDTIFLADGTYTAPTSGFPAATTDQTWLGAPDSGTILSGVSGMTAPIVTVTSGSVELSLLTISGGTNDTTDDGGGVANSGTLVIDNSVVTDNEVSAASGAAYGGGVFSNGTLTLATDNFSGNTAYSPTGVFGGAVDNAGGILNVTQVSFTDNTATAVGLICGGAICNEGTATVSHAIFSDNSDTTSTFSHGGAIDSLVTLTATDDYFTGNSAVFGGGITSEDSGTLTAADDTFSENTALEGGGIYSVNSTATLTSDTFSDNAVSGDGGGFYGADGSVSVVGSTFSGNSAADGNSMYANAVITVADNVFSSAASACDQNGSTWVDDGYNVASDASCFSTIPATGDDNAGSGLATALSPLEDNGGPTFTVALLAGNPALGIIPNNSAVTITQADGTSYTPCPIVTDQRGIASTPGAACDSGAVQSTFLATVNGFFSFATINYGDEATFALHEGHPQLAFGTFTFSSTSPSATLCSYTYPIVNSCTTSPTLHAGTYTGIVATFTDTDGTYSSAVAANVLSLTVQRVVASTSTTLNLASSSVEFGQEHFETFAAKVTGHTGDGYPKGSVTVFSGSTPLCSAPLAIGTGDAATAKCALGNQQLNAATYPNVSARYTPGSGSSSNTNYIYTASASALKLFTVSPASTTTTLTLTSPITFGSEGAETFHIKVTATGATPAGSILILSNSTILCSTTLGSGGTGTCTLTAKELKARTYSVTAIYNPSNPDFLPSSSTPHTLVVHH